MRELLEKNQRITMVPFDFKNANKGVITEVNPDSFILELDYDPVGVLKSNYCEFYTTTSNGMHILTLMQKKSTVNLLKLQVLQNINFCKDAVLHV